jgi:N-acetylneuraminic acid mutarotase
MYFLLSTLILSTFSVKVSHHPSTGTPPISQKASCLTYNSSGTLYYFGGHEKSDKVHNELYTFDTTSNIWSESVPIASTKPDARYNPGCFTFGHLFYVFAGNTNSGPVNDLWAYDPVLMDWSQVETSTKPSFRYLFGSCTFKYNEKNYFAIYGGWKDEGLSSGFYL